MYINHIILLKFESIKVYVLIVIFIKYHYLLYHSLDTNSIQRLYLKYIYMYTYIYINKYTSTCSGKYFIGKWLFRKIHFYHLIKKLISKYIKIYIYIFKYMN